MADKSIKFSQRVVENVLIKVGKFFLPADFVILDMEEDEYASIILGRSFLATGRALIDMEKGELMLRVNEEHIIFNVFKSGVKDPGEKERCLKIESLDPSVKEALDDALKEDPPPHLKKALDNENHGISMPLTVESHSKFKEKEEIIKQPKLELKSVLHNHSSTFHEKEVQPIEDTSLKEVGKSSSHKPQLQIDKTPPMSKPPKRPRGWRYKKYPTEGFSPGQRVLLSQSSPDKWSRPFEVTRILSLEHMEIMNEDNGHKFTVRGERLKHYEPS